MELDSWCRRHRTRLVASAVLALGLVGCSPGEEVSRPLVDPTPAPAVGGLRWTVPDRWIERAPTGMRAAAYEVPDGKPGTPARCSVFYFGQGRTGTMDANLNRWRAQFSVVQHDDRSAREIGGLRLTVVEIWGTYAPTSSAGKPPRTCYCWAQRSKVPRARSSSSASAGERFSRRPGPSSPPSSAASRSSERCRARCGRGVPWRVQSRESEGRVCQPAGPCRRADDARPAG